MFKVNNEDTRTTALTSFWFFYCYFGTYFTSLSSVSIVDFEQEMFAGYMNPSHAVVGFVFQCKKIKGKNSSEGSTYKPNLPNFDTIGRKGNTFEAGFYLSLF